jgi:DNA invertase Pin-like site-specific DNA recombinase
VAGNNSLSALLYSRVSQEIQAEGNSVSIEQQLLEMRKLCETRNWHIANEFVDFQNYIATQAPEKGKTVNPSGERADRPAFLEMLEAIRTGQYDITMCWRDDRLVRHPRVEVALEDALDLGDINRKGQEKIQIMDATGAIIDRFTLSIKASVWREENKRRADRGKMGKKATLMTGRWCGEYRRYGYQSVKIPGQRGRIIELDPVTAPIVRKIFEMYDGGYRIVDIRDYLIEKEVPQIYTGLVKHKWQRPLIDRILKSEEYYLGEAVWKFGDGKVIKIKIPQIIDADLWERVQGKFERNKRLSPRNSKEIYLLQGLAFCGNCSYQMGITHCKGYGSYGYGDGTGHAYRCTNASANPHEEHSLLSSFNGVKLEWTVWRYILDKLLPNPQFVVSQVESRINELQKQGDNANGEIAQINKALQDLETERAFYQKKTAQGKISELEFDQRMDETTSEIERLNAQLAYLLKLRHEAEVVQNSLDYVSVLFSHLKEKAFSLDVVPQALAEMTKAERDENLKGRKTILRMLISKAILFSSQKIKLLCAIDGSETLILGIQGSWSPLLKLEFEYEICIDDWVDNKSRKHWWIKPKTND